MSRACIKYPYCPSAFTRSPSICLGFQKAVTKPETLEINQSLRIDVKMAVGNRSDEIVVEEGITRVETISPTLGLSITSNQIARMPLNGRNTLDLALLQPGVLPASSTITRSTSTGTFNVAGGRQDSVTYLLDGRINNNLLNNNFVLNPNPDMIDEFRILTSTYDAEYGRNAGGIVSVVNLHPHIHVLVLDGVFAGLEKETPCFYPLRAPDDPDVAAVAETTSRRTQALLTKKGIGASSDEKRRRGSADARYAVARRVICPWSARAHRHGAERRKACHDLGRQRRSSGAGTIRAALRQCR